MSVSSLRCCGNRSTSYSTPRCKSAVKLCVFSLSGLTVSRRRISDGLTMTINEKADESEKAGAESAKVDRRARAAKAGKAALKSPSEGVVPHPVLDVPVQEAAYTRSTGMDWVVFGVTAVIAIGFLGWGFVSTESLAGAS